ncbi:diguanylate cyclase domain-containing protein [Corallincola platygyrae]|uniref:diguanylate cyclase n=1 Tax=Corallincola platygyrae TaxID=1193278 RepID=A0ABW4XQC7_9GAMM
MSIKTRFLIIFLILSVMLITIMLCIQRINHHSDQAITAELRRNDSLELAHQLRQSSDDLTRMARSFASTGEPRYEKYFYEILSIRDGKSPRPTDYDGVYWDYITALYEDYSPAKGDNTSLVSLFEKLGATPEEMDTLHMALERSDKLSYIEVEALNAMKGLFRGKDGSFSVTGQANQDYAITLLYSNDYHQAKATIMHPIAKFYDQVDERTAAQLDASWDKQQRYETIAFYLIIATAAFFLYSIFHIRKKIVNPILELSDVANRIKDGNSEDRASIKTNDEIGMLARSFNEMNDNLSGVINKLEQLSYVDSLTQLANRRVFNQTLNTELRRHQRSGKPLTLMLVDIDFFKRLNDSAGHQAGDHCLAEIADVLSSHFERAGDLVARYGGEEFAVILPDTDANVVEDLCPNTCKAIEDARIPHPDSPISDFITASIGAISVIPDREVTTEYLIKSADDALYQAKAGGRNRAKVVNANPMLE